MKKIILTMLIFLLVVSPPAFAYIDPATGSMLFSVFIGIITTLFFLLQNLWYKLQSLFSDKSLSKENIPFVIYSEGKKYDNLFLPILDEFEKREISVVFYTSSSDDIALKKNYKYVNCQYIGEGNKTFYKLAFLRADICLMTTPHLDVFQLRRSKYVKHYCHIPHAIGDFCGYKLYGIDYYDSILLTTEHNISIIREIEQKRKINKKELITVGSPQLDYMQTNIKKMELEQKEKFTVLFSPSWGESSVLSRFGDIILEQLSQMTDWNIIFRPHPQSYIAEKEKLDYLFKKYEKFQNIIFDKSPDNIHSLSQADIMISDFSSIVYEFSFLFNKPVVYMIQNMNFEVYDISTLGRLTWRYDVIDKLGTEINSENIKNLIPIIENIEKSINIQEVKDFAWQKQGEGAKNTVDFLVKKQQELAENDANSI